jgi:hypothetical protein
VTQKAIEKGENRSYPIERYRGRKGAKQKIAKTQ